MSRLIDLTGRRFGRLVVIERKENNAHRRAMWLCRCDCGGETVVPSHHLMDGSAKSCGCLRKETHMKHGATRHAGLNEPLYGVWAEAKQRCSNPKNKQYKDYGGRGITVCDEWCSDYEAFRDWALSHGYEKGLTLDRRDNDGPYAPWNCRWVTMKVQNNNRRPRRKKT